MGSHRILATIVNMDQPGRYVHWSIFTVAVANLIIIGVMVVLFGLALLLPFPKGRLVKHAKVVGPDEDESGERDSSNVDADNDGMWTAKVRKLGLRLLP